MCSQDAFIMQTCLCFPVHVLATCFAFFPPLSFPLYFFPYSVSVLGFVSSSSSPSLSCVSWYVLYAPFFFSSSMVDYSAVRVDYPSVTFIFAHLGCLLKSVEGECLERVSFFVGENYPYTSVLSSLFPLK